MTYYWLVRFSGQFLVYPNLKIAQKVSEKIIDARITKAVRTDRPNCQGKNIVGRLGDYWYWEA